MKTNFSEAVEGLLRDDGDPYVRSLAARALPALRGIHAVSVLIQVLGGNDPHSAAGAAIGLGRVGTDEAIEALKHRTRELLDAGASSDRSTLLIALVGALESTINSETVDEEMGLIFSKALNEPVAWIKTSSASALGKMRRTSSWQALRALAEPQADTTSPSQAVRGSAAYACDQLSLVLEDDQLGEAETLFRKLVDNTQEIPQVRRPAASGIVKLIGQGYRSLGLINDLIRSARDLDIVVARSAFVALSLLDPEEILEDYILLLSGLGLKRRQALCAVIRGRPTRTGFSLLMWLLGNDSDPRVLASAFDSAGEMLKNARQWTRVAVPRGLKLATLIDLGDTNSLAALAGHCLNVSRDGSPSVIASSLIALGELARLDAFRRGGQLQRTRDDLLEQTRALLRHPNAMVQEGACYSITSFSEPEDLARLQSIAQSTSDKNVREAAIKAEKYLKRLLSNRPPDTRLD